MRRIIGRAAAIIVFAFASQGALAGDLGYDPKADPFEQYHAAIERAESEHKLVLVIAGGDWCRWCHVLERFVSNDAEVERRLHETFVVVKAYVGFDNYNELFFSQLPPAIGAPHFWIISPEREVLASQSTAKLEAGKTGYDKQAFLDFLAHWQAEAGVTKNRRIAAR